MAARCSRSARVDGKWQVVPDSEIRPPHHDADTDDGDHRPGGRPCAHADQGRPDRRAGARHAQQLRRRRDAVGHLAHLRGELPRLLLGQARRRPSGGRATTSAMACRGNWLQLGQLLRPLRRRQGAERAQPLRLDGRDRSVRPDLDAEEAHGARAASSTRAPPASSTRTAASWSTWATTSGSTMSTGSSPPARFDPANRAANMRPPRRGHAVGRELQRRRHARLAAAGPRPGSAHRRERLQRARPTC